jgi:hypothetical protein
MTSLKEKKNQLRLRQQIHLDQAILQHRKHLDRSSTRWTSSRRTSTSRSSTRPILQIMQGQALPGQTHQGGGGGSAAQNSGGQQGGGTQQLTTPRPGGLDEAIGSTPYVGGGVQQPTTPRPAGPSYSTPGMSPSGSSGSNGSNINTGQPNLAFED